MPRYRVGYYNEGVSGWWGLMGVLLVAVIVLPILGVLGAAVIKLMTRPEFTESEPEKPAFDREGQRLA